MPAWFGLVGKLHVVLVHFPIALMLLACLCEGLHLALRRPFFHHAAEFNLGLAILATIVTIIFGWILAATTHDIPADVKYLLPWHRWLGVAALVSAIGAFASLYLSRLHWRGWIALYWTLLAISGLLIAITGHLGGTLVYGADYFQ